LARPEVAVTVERAIVAAVAFDAIATRQIAEQAIGGASPVRIARDSAYATSATLLLEAVGIAQAFDAATTLAVAYLPFGAVE
jgi:hypothetical protein